MTKAADIMAAATPGPWLDISDVDSAGWQFGGNPDDFAVIGSGEDEQSVADARAIVTAVNLFPLYEAVREAAAGLATSEHGAASGVVGGPPHRPEDFTWYVSRDALDRLRAELVALQAAEDAL